MISRGGKELKNLPQTATKNNTKTAHNLSNPFALLIVSGFDLLYTLVEFFFKKGDTACYIHLVSTAAEARSARKRALDRKRAEACDRPATLNRCGHFDEKYAASLKGTCRLFTFVRSFSFSYFFN
jgi:hypothetical protein